MSCLDNIISIGACNGSSLSGLDLFDAPELSIKILAETANETYVSGMELATSKVQLATRLVKNDLHNVMAANNVLPNITDIRYQAATFKPEISMGASDKQRGLILHKNGRIKGNMTKQVIHNVYAYPFTTKNDVVLYVYDTWAGGTLTTYDVNFTANQINTFNIEYTVLGSYARVYIEDADISMASSYLTCFTGCNGGLPNSCGHVKGFYDGREINTKQGYGLSMEFSCKCDYDELLCGLARGTLGNIVWMKARIELLDSLLKTDRLNNWVVYGRDETKQFRDELYNDYVSAWNTFAMSLPNVLKNMRDDCLDCRGIRYVTNV